MSFVKNIYEKVVYFSSRRAPVRGAETPLSSPNRINTKVKLLKLKYAYNVL